MAAPRRPLPPFRAHATAGPWLCFRLLATANPARATAPAWSAPELFEAAQAEGLSTTIGSMRTALADVLKPHGLVERANSDARDSRDVALRLSAAGRALAAQHGVALAPPVDGPLPERKLGRRPACGDTVPTDDGRARPSAPGPAATRGRWLYFRLLAAANPAANGRAEWRTTELARAASAALTRDTSEQAASAGLTALARAGLVTRTYVNSTAPWRYTDAGAAKARELGIAAPAAYQA